MGSLDVRQRLLLLGTALGLTTLALAGCAGSDPVPLGTPMPPVVETSPTPVPTASGAPTASPVPASVPPVPIQRSDPGSQVAPTVVPPTRLTIGAVDIDMAVLPMGVDQAGQMELPEDSGQAGWYRFGPAPADTAGTTVIAAHVDSLEFGLGQFVRLRDIVAGETVTVASADGTEHAYTVSQITRTPKTDVALDQIFDRSGEPRLVLVTCGGVFNRDTGHYLDNVIVTATPVA
ncbi:hypothetical protein B7R54_16275 [Subtercola boreus]|uniref:Sortase n=1 Tax=Subtercola boreus TaxID=120213 RepID=A0A3E0VL17_9MICO|nr:class F sortase [Subtercola boreus]RFA10586.1 hypothetical protein B7R54_16275 [Subtercola boreus]TQL55866.1 sortase family protein [Subtercola boreus]